MTDVDKLDPLNPDRPSRHQIFSITTNHLVDSGNKYLSFQILNPHQRDGVKLLGVNQALTLVWKNWVLRQENGLRARKSLQYPQSSEKLSEARNRSRKYKKKGVQEKKGDSFPHIHPHTIRPRPLSPKHFNLFLFLRLQLVSLLFIFIDPVN